MQLQQLALHAIALAVASMSINLAYAADNDVKQNKKVSKQSDEVITLKEINVAGQDFSDSYTTDSTSAATGLDLSLKDTPQSVTVITQQRIKDQNLNTLGKVLDQTPGISRLQYGSVESGYSSVYARGYGVDNYSIDGVATSARAFSGVASKGISTMSSVGYDNVSVVRGATGLMTGIGDPSASVVVERKRPTAEPALGFSLGAGNWNRYNTQIDVSGSLNKAQTLRGRSILAYTRGNTFQKRAFNEFLVSYNILEYDLNPNTLLTAGVELQRQRSNNSVMHSFDVEDNAGYATSFGPKDNNATNWSYRNFDYHNLFLGVKHQFDNNWQLDAQYSYSNNTVNQEAGVAGSYNIAHDTGAAFLTANKSNSSPHQHIFNIKLSGEYSLWQRQHELMAGISYGHYSDNSLNWQRTTDTPIDNIYAYDGNMARPNWQQLENVTVKEIQAGVYVATRLHPIDNMAIILGTRLSNWKQENTGPSKWDNSSQSEKHILTPYVGVVYNISPQLSTYASYTTIFKPQSAKDKTGATLKPEQGSNFELGLKGEFFENSLNASLAIFQTRKDNLAVSDEPNLVPGSADFASRAENHTKGNGFELEVQGAITPNWNLQAGYTYALVKDNDKKPLNTKLPKQQFKLFSTYSLPVAGKNLTLGGGMRWQSKIYQEGAINPANYQQKSYAVIDVMANYNISKQLSLAINLENIFNKTYWLSPASHTYGTPRNIMATLHYQF